jgi:TusA-related sulfurtransferase
VTEGVPAGGGPEQAPAEPPIQRAPNEPGTPLAAALVVDSRGKRCPLPVIELARRIGDVGVGEVVALLADDPAARVDVPAWCRMRGQEFAGESAGPGGVPRYAVRRLQ